jgi:hypothetical protein
MPPKLYYSEILNSSLQTRISSNIPVENVLTSYSNLFFKKSSLLAASPEKAGSNLVEIRIPKNINEIRLEVLDIENNHVSDVPKAAKNNQNYTSSKLSIMTRLQC